DIIAVGGSDGRIRTWQAGQNHYRVSQEQHSAKVNAISFLNLLGSPMLVSSGADSILRLWPNMRRSLTFPLPEPVTQIVASGTQVVMASGPALSLLELDQATADRESLNACGEDSFTSMSELKAGGTLYPDVLDGILQGSSARIIQLARSMLEGG